MRRWLALTAAVLVATALLARPAWAATWAEAGDAGDLPATAQQPVGSGALDELSGVLDDGGDEDLFRICLTGGGTFSATTVDQAGSVIDTQLFLFDSSGAGVYANDDDAASGSSRSTLPSGDPLTPTATGVYYLAISAFNNDPRDAGGEDIFPGSVTDVEGPVDGDHLSSWTGAGGESGDYTIALTGAEFCPATAICDAPPPIPEGARAGTDGSEALVGTDGPDVILAFAGNDTVRGLGGDDLIVGGAGNDILDGGDGNDVVCGGAGNDFMTGGAGDDVLSGDDGYDALSGGAGDDALSGGPLNDRLDGGAGTNTNDGGPGTDSCTNPSSGPGCP